MHQQLALTIAQQTKGMAMTPSHDLSGWTPRARPARKVLDGRYARLEPLTAALHGDDLYHASTPKDAEARFAWLPETPPQNKAAYHDWATAAEASKDPLYFAVIDKATGKAGGRQTLMRHDTANGVIEVGHIYWGPQIAGQRTATEALFLFASYVFDELGYRRFEWKCNDANSPSKSAAQRFGFSPEGVFRQAMVIKGANRDTAWFSIIDSEWPALKAGFETWLNPSNFDGDGQQIHKLTECRTARTDI